MHWLGGVSHVELARQLRTHPRSGELRLSGSPAVGVATLAYDKRPSLLLVFMIHLAGYPLQSFVMEVTDSSGAQLCLRDTIVGELFVPLNMWQVLCTAAQEWRFLNRDG